MLECYTYTSIQKRILHSHPSTNKLQKIIITASPLNLYIQAKATVRGILSLRKPRQKLHHRLQEYLTRSFYPRTERKRPRERQPGTSCSASAPAHTAGPIRLIIFRCAAASDVLSACAVAGIIMAKTICARACRPARVYVPCILHVESETSSTASALSRPRARLQHVVVVVDAKASDECTR